MNPGQSGELDLGIAGISDAVEIGAGGFGVVYRAVEEDLGRTVAVKVLTGNLDEGARNRFERERRAMGRLSGHPNIVTIYRGGYTAAGNAYLVMEFLDQGSLADRLVNVGPLGWEEAAKFGVQLSGALETSHRAGVLHRDIKPGNILLSRLGNAKLCDFGIARLQGAPETKSSVITASLAHAPPDIISGARPTARSDVYSLASTIYELVAARPPFVSATDESVVPIIARIAQDPLPRLPEPRLPAPIFDVIERATAKDPAERPATALEFAELLVDAQRRLGLPATPIPIETVEPDPGGSSSRTHVPFPDTGSGPLPPPVARSPHPTGPQQGDPGAVDPQAVAAATSDELPTYAAEPTIVTDSSIGTGGVEPGSVVSGPLASPGPTPAAPQHPPTPSAAPQRPDPQPSTSGDWSPPGGTGGITGVHGTDGPPSGSKAGGGIGRLAIIGAIAVVALLAIVAGILATRDSGDDTAGNDDDGTGSPTTAYNNTESSTDAAGGDDGDGDDPDGDYETYRTISDVTGTITIDVPAEWIDESTQLGTDNTPQITVGPDLDNFIDSYEGPGVQVAVARGSRGDLLDLALDPFIDPNCQPGASRRPISTPLVGLAERFTECAGSDTELLHIAFIDGANDLTALLRVQIVSERDRVAAETITRSLRLADRLP